MLPVFEKLRIDAIYTTAFFKGIDNESLMSRFAFPLTSVPVPWQVIWSGHYCNSQLPLFRRSLSAQSSCLSLRSLSAQSSCLSLRSLSAQSSCLFLRSLSTQSNSLSDHSQFSQALCLSDHSQLSQALCLSDHSQLSQTLCLSDHSQLSQALCLSISSVDWLHAVRNGTALPFKHLVCFVLPNSVCVLLNVNFHACCTV